MRRRPVSFSTIMWSKHSRRIERIKRSTYAFCQGDCGALRTIPCAAEVGPQGYYLPRLPTCPPAIEYGFSKSRTTTLTTGSDPIPRLLRIFTGARDSIISSESIQPKSRKCTAPYLPRGRGKGRIHLSSVSSPAQSCTRPAAPPCEIVEPRG